MEPYHHGRRGKDSGVVCGMSRGKQTTCLMLIMVASMSLVLVWEAMPFTSSNAVGTPILNRELGSELDELAKSYESQPFLRTVPLSRSKEDDEDTDESSSSEADAGELTESDSTPTRAGTRIKEFIQNASEVIPEESTSAEDEQIEKVEKVKGDVNTGEVHVSKNETNTGELETIAPFESLQRSNKISARESEELFLAETEAALKVNSSLNSTTQHEEPLKTATEKLVELSKSPEEKQSADKMPIEANFKERRASLPLGESASNHSSSNDTSAKAKNLSSAVKDEADDEAEEEPPEIAAEKFVESFESQAEKRAQMIIDAYPKERRPTKPLGESAFNHSSSNATSAKAKNVSAAVKDEAEDGDEEEFSQTAADNDVELPGSLTEKQNKTRIETYLKERRTSKPLGESAVNRSSSDATAAKAKNLSTAVKDEADDEADNVADDAAEEEPLESAAENLVEPSELPAEKKTPNRTAIESYSKERITSKRLGASASNHSSLNATDAKPNSLSSTLKDEAEDESEEEPSRIAAEKFVESSELSTEKQTAGNTTTEANSMERHTVKSLDASATNHSSNATTDAKNLSSAMKVEADEVAITQEINSLNAKNTSQKCDYSVGSWVKDDSRPLYSGLECKMWLSPVFACRLNKHPDKKYDRYRWQPTGCNLPVFNASAVLETLRNKVLAIAGDSLGHQQLQSLLCMLTRGKNTTAMTDIGKQFNFYTSKGERRPNGYAYRFDATNTTIVFKWTVTLARVQPINASDPQTRNALHIDRPVKFLEDHLHQLDVVVLNSGHHWNRGKMRLNKYDFYHKGKPANLSVSQAYNMTVHNVVHFAHMKTQNTSKIVYYRSLSPRHFRNGDWNTGGTCDTIRFEDDKQVQEGNHIDPHAESAILGTTVNLLNITSLSLQRGEAHVSKYSVAKSGQDCLHWCLPGIPDTWNEILFADLATKLTSTAIAS